MMPSSENVEARMVRHCTLCGSEGDILYPELSDRFYGVAGRWNLRQCRQAACGLLWLDPMPTEQGIGKVYQNYITHGLQKTPTLWNWAMDLGKSLLRIDSLSKRLAKLRIPVGAKGVALEIGCGAGALLAQLRARGWNVTGTDVDLVAVKAAKVNYGLDVRSGRIEDLALPDNAYDLIIVHHVLEHVHDPVALLTEGRRLLKPGGLISIATPNLASWQSRCFGKNWFALEPPRHLYLFSPKNLAACAAKAGFIQPRIWTTNAESLVPLIGSIDIRRTGRHLAGGQRAIRDLLVGLVEKKVEMFWTLIDPEAGAEIILQAVKR